MKPDFIRGLTPIIKYNTQLYNVKHKKSCIR